MGHKWSCIESDMIVSSLFLHIRWAVSDLIVHLASMLKSMCRLLELCSRKRQKVAYRCVRCVIYMGQFYYGNACKTYVWTVRLYEASWQHLLIQPMVSRMVAKFILEPALNGVQVRDK
jgi:hypothetical protein